jgi:transaldolase / glucose-6-phosphate isomerase
MGGLHMTKIHELADLGQAIWLDYIRRSFITSGELQTLIDKGVRGVTSNPAIFEKAIAGSDDYDDQMQQLVVDGADVEDIFEELAVEDIKMATDLFRPVFDETKGHDGYVSLEVNPRLAYDTDGTIAEATRYFGELNRPNLMIKVPATKEGIPAVEHLIAEGVNVNITLMFSMAHYEAVAEAYIRGLERLAQKGGDLSKVASVASFFVSRVDAKLDPQLEQAGADDLLGKIAIANSKLVYQRFKQIFSGERWDRLAAQGARVQRPLWASTSTKNPAYPDTLYVDTLIGPHTVNTLPPETLDAFLDHGVVAVTVEDNIDEARAQIEKLGTVGIDLDQATEELQQEGVDKFIAPFDSLLKTIATKRDSIRAEWQNVSAQLRSYQSPVDAALNEIERRSIVKRIWERDHTVWRPDSTEITNRLGWLDVAEVMQERYGDNTVRAVGDGKEGEARAWSSVGTIKGLVDAVRSEGYTHALLLGMGGSSLAPEVLRKTFGVADGYLDLAVLDSTDAGAVKNYDRQFDPEKTLYIVSTKSGGTVETLSFFKYFYNRAVEAVGANKAGEHFIAITDPGSSLEKLAQQYNFRATFLNDPDIGGRYSAQSYFGLVPAALLGVDVPRLLQRIITMANGCKLSGRDNPGAWLGVILGELMKAGRDKVTFITSPSIASFGDWVEQLIAESTGKEGKGIVPVVGEPMDRPDAYGNDRVFVYLHLEGEDDYDAQVSALEAEHPVVRLNLKDLYDLGGQFFLWEFAVAVAGHIIGIQPFDQPNVESAKVRAKEMVKAYTETGALPEPEPVLNSAGIKVFADVEGSSLTEIVNAFLKQANGDDYIALQAYVTPDEQTNAVLNDLREALRAKTRLATTLGYGPRFLHSTGQLHKGDGGNGLFIQLISAGADDVRIPDEAGKADSSITFDVLKRAQALGDREALLENKRRVITFQIDTDVVAGLKAVRSAL